MTVGQPFFVGGLVGQRRQETLAFGQERRNGVMEETKKLGGANTTATISRIPIDPMIIQVMCANPTGCRDLFL